MDNARRADSRTTRRCEQGCEALTMAEAALASQTKIWTRREARARIDWVGYVFIGFFTVPFLIFNVGPVLFGIYVGFTEWGIIGDPTWVGWQNFHTAFADDWFWVAFKNVFLYALIIVPGVTILGLGFALFVDQGWPLSTVARTILFTPNVVSATVIGLVWVWVLDTQFGVVNHYLGFLGIPPIPWLTSVHWSLIGVSIASIWWDMGLAFVLFLAALQDVPLDLYEAAHLDGASRAQRFRHVTLPHIRPTVSMVVTLQLIATMRIFSQVYVMTNCGPAGGSLSVIYYVYQMGVVQFLLGLASAVSTMLFLAILVVTAIQRFILRESTRG
jgi:multiple sugar transport system permease protein